MSSPPYTDGIKVKISEKYKPPRKINLVMSYSQRLTLNKHIQESMPDYNFSMEENVLGNLQELKSMRNHALIEKQTRLKEAREAFEIECAKRLQEQTKLNETKKNLTAEAPIITSQQNYLSSGILMPTQATYSYSTILTPMPSDRQSHINHNSDDYRPFNISDFEEDTSSPFDNMELKSINDMEELAQVLKPQVSNYSQYSTNNSQYTNLNHIPNMYSHPITTSYSHTNGYYYHPPHSSSNIASFSNCKSEPDIVQSVNNEMSGLNIGNQRSWEPKSPVKEILEDPFDDLSMRDQDFCRNVCAMGFPLGRVARACKLLGNDHKRVVEHLLALSDLLDLGFSESLVSKALLKFDNDKDKALDSLIS